MDIKEIYDLTSGKLLEEIAAVDNPFIRQIANLASEQAKQLKVVSFVLKDKVNNRGEIAQKGISPADKSVIDLTKLTPLTQQTPARNLLEEVAYYRAAMLNFQEASPTFWKDNAEILMVDYLLSSSLCYVEVFDNSANVEKFFATRNRFLAGEIVGASHQETAKYVSYLQTYAVNYQSKQLKVLKLNANKSGFKVSQPRTHLDFNKSIKITPLVLMSSFTDGVSEILNSKILKFTYIKDNLTEREFVTTLSPQILHQYYEGSFVQKMMGNVAVKLTRGYVRLPELGISKYDASGVRALNISRITSVEVIDSFDSSFIDVDFDTILPAFKETIMQQRDPNILNAIHEDLTGGRAYADNIHELRNSLISFVDGQYAMGTTTALRYIHSYMVQRAQFFPLYNGGKPVQYGSIGNGFNLGTIE